MIFVQIAAYRETDLANTVRDCIESAKWPHDLRFGICWQCDEQDTSLDPWKDDARFRIARIPWQQSKGLCFARAMTQTMYRGEEFTLQIDAHHRFVAHWDEAMIAMLALTGSRKPILGSYAGVRTPEGNHKVNPEPYKMVADRFTPGGTIIFRPREIEGWRDLSAPIPARFCSGHYMFTLGAHCEEYRYDPNLYFAGDEISLAIRGFTMGWDLFHPHRSLLWHEYTRAGRPKHWDDHVRRPESGDRKPESSKLAAMPGWLAWHERDAISKRRLRKLLREEDNDADITGYDLGTVRSHRDYELYAGIDFAGRRLHPDTLAGANPPTEPFGVGDGGASWKVASPKTLSQPGEPWLYTAHCQSRAHCQACRHDAEFRQSIMDGGMSAVRDFDCIWGEDPPNPSEGPGTRLMRILKRMGFREGPGCGCRDMARKMNLWGADGTRQHSEEILDVMEQASGKRVYNPLRIPFVRAAARRLVLHCARS